MRSGSNFVYSIRTECAKRRAWCCPNGPTRSGTAICPDAAPGLLYGYRVHGPYDPLNGHRFNPNKLLIDPYARALNKSCEWNEIHCGYVVGDPRTDLSFDTRDNAAFMPKGRVVALVPAWTDDKRPQTPRSHSVIYEMHVRGYTMRHPEIAENIRGTAAALRHPKIIRHLGRAWHNGGGAIAGACLCDDAGAGAKRPA